MSRKAIIAISAIVLIYSIYINNQDGETPDWNFLDSSSEVEEEKEALPVFDNFPQPENGFSPYNDYFGRGVYNNDTGNEFIIKNSNSTDAVVLLVNAYSDKKVRNEYIRKGSTFSMSGVPNGTYYLQWSSGNNWSPNKTVGNLTGGFQEDISFAKTENRNDWMAVEGYQQWTVTLYSVTDGDVETDNISASEFSN
jgi:hypothetical protein